MNKQTIITVLLALVAIMGQAQTKTATITGYSPALKDGTVAESSIDNVRVASDTIIGGHFTLTVPVEGLTKSYLFLAGEGCPNHLMTIWLQPGADVKVTGKDCLYPLWKVESPLPEQQTLSRIMEYGHDTLAEFLRLNLANAPWDEYDGCSPLLAGRCCIARRVRRSGYDGKKLYEGLPVYGAVEGIGGIHRRPCAERV